METKDNNIDISNLSLSQGYKSLYEDTCTIIEDTRQYAYRAVNISLTIRNWLLGKRIAKDELDGADRAEYGKGIIKVLAKDLSAKYGKGLDFSSLYQYIRFYRLFPEILDAVSPKSRITNAKQTREILDQRPGNGTNKKHYARCGAQGHCIATLAHNTTSDYYSQPTRKRLQMRCTS